MPISSQAALARNASDESICSTIVQCTAKSTCEICGRAGKLLPV